jgi:preprotein translocase subunit SecD
MLKYWRLWLLLVVVLGSLFAIGFTDRRYGVEVVYVTKDSPAFGTLEQGMVISSFNGNAIKNIDDWESATLDAKGPITVRTAYNEYGFSVNETLGIEVQDIQRLNLDFGLDLQGGTRIVLKPTVNATRNMIEQVIGTLQTRINIYGLKEIKFFPVESPDGWYVQIEATGLSSDVVNELLTSKGSFEAKISKPVELHAGKGDIVLGPNSYDIEVLNDTVMVDGKEVPENGSFVLEGIVFELGNRTSGQIMLMGIVYRGDDIENIYTDPQHSSIVPTGNFYRFYFTVLVSSDGAERFGKVTSGVPSQLDLDSGEYYLKDCSIYLYLDNELQSTLRIASSLGGQAYSTPQIEGGREKREDALQEKLRLQTILRSGSLPVSMETSSISIISPTLGSNFIESALLAALAAGIAVVVIIFIRYRSLRVGIPLVLTGLSEALIILGISASGPYDLGIWAIVLLADIVIIGLAWWKLKESDMSAWIGALLIPLLGLMMSWNIDLPAIGGIIAAIGVGVDQMVVIADETLGGRRITRKIYTLKEKIGKAFFIIFTAAATTTAALLPLLFVAAGVFIRGFVITTVVGILTGILISRPAYAKIVEFSAENIRKEEE